MSPILLTITRTVHWELWPAGISGESQPCGSVQGLYLKAGGVNPSNRPSRFKQHSAGSENYLGLVSDRFAL